MDFENERVVLSARFKAFWEGAVILALSNPVPAVEWNNQPFTQPQNLPWVRFNLIPVTTDGGSVGGNLVRSVGIMAIQIFIPGTTGSALARKLCDALATEFNFATIAVARGYLHFKTCSPEDYGHNDGYYQFNANLPFWRDTRLDGL